MYQDVLSLKAIESNWQADKLKSNWLIHNIFLMIIIHHSRKMGIGFLLSFLNYPTTLVRWTVSHALRGSIGLVLLTLWFYRQGGSCGYQEPEAEDLERSDGAYEEKGLDQQAKVEESVKEVLSDMTRETPTTPVKVSVMCSFFILSRKLNLISDLFYFTKIKIYMSDDDL